MKNVTDSVTFIDLTQLPWLGSTGRTRGRVPSRAQTRPTAYQRRVKKQNEEEAGQARLRDIAERDALVFERLEQHRALQDRIQRLENLLEKSDEGLSRDRDLDQDQ